MSIASEDSRDAARGVLYVFFRICADPEPPAEIGRVEPGPLACEILTIQTANFLLAW